MDPSNNVIDAFAPPPPLKLRRGSSDRVTLHLVFLNRRTELTREFHQDLVGTTGTEGILHAMSMVAELARQAQDVEELLGVTLSCPHTMELAPHPDPEPLLEPEGQA